MTWFYTIIVSQCSTMFAVRSTLITFPHKKNIYIAQQWSMPLITVHKGHHSRTLSAVDGWECALLCMRKLMHQCDANGLAYYCNPNGLVYYCNPRCSSVIISSSCAISSRVLQHCAHNSGLDTVCAACLALIRVWSLCICICICNYIWICSYT